MLPPYSSEDPTTPEDSIPSPRRKLPGMRVIIPGLAIVLIVAVLVGVLQIARGAGNTPRQASGPMPTATAATGATANDTPAPGPTPPPTATNNPPAPTADVRVTQNQNERQPCINDPAASYSVTLFNAGTLSANWHVYVPAVYGADIGGTQPLVGPLSSYPYWAVPEPQDGSIAPGQSASFRMTMHYPMPCGSKLYEAAVQLSFPSGGSQADIPLTFGGTGPSPYSKVILVSGSLSITQPCPASGSAPAPFIFAIKNTGNAKAYPSIDVFKERIGADGWAAYSATSDRQNADLHWLYAGETWTVTVAPRAGVLCGGTIYHVYIYITNADGSNVTMTMTDTFTAS